MALPGPSTQKAHMSQPDTKAAWKRRALRAEHELETLRRIREFEHKQELQMIRVDAAQAIALREIQEILTSLKSDEPTAGLT